MNRGKKATVGKEREREKDMQSLAARRKQKQQRVREMQRLPKSLQFVDFLSAR